MTRVRRMAGVAPVLVALAALALSGACGGKAATSDNPGQHGPLDPLPLSDGGEHRGPSPLLLDGGWEGGAPSDQYPAAHPGMPQVEYSGGRVLKAPRAVAITFDGDPYRATLEDFVSRLGGTPFWAATTAEYGVGALVAAPPARIHEAPAKVVDDRAIQTWLRAKLEDPEGELGAPDEQTIYTFFYPQGVSINLEGYTSCDVFGGYHAEVDVGQLHIAYAVIPRCATFAEVHGFDVLTVAGSHELIEATTDPLPYTAPAYEEPDDNHAVWGFFTGGETGDMCTFNQGAFYKPAGFPFMVQRSWSNAAAAAGHDPCAPSLPSEVYFNSALVLPDKVSMLGNPTQGLRIPVHEKMTVELALYSDGPTDGPWHVSAQDLSEAVGGPPVLSFSFDRSRGVNGERLHMTIEVLAIDPQYGGEGFVVTSELHGQSSYWYGFVQN